MFDKSDIRTGAYLTLGCPIRAYVHYSDAPSRAPVRYGEPFAEVSSQLSEAQRRLIALSKAINARR